MTTSRRFARGPIVVIVVLMLLSLVPVVTAAPRIPRQDVLALRTFGLAPALDPALNPGQGTIGRNRCETSGNPAADIDISCDDPLAPDNELAIVVDPEDPDHLLAGSNDYQLRFVGNTAVVRVPTGFFVSFDGGATWVDGQIPLGNSTGAGDPAPAFNAKFDTAHMASLGFVFGQGGPHTARGNVTVATSYDGGLTWDNPVTVARGTGSDNSAQQIFLDKEWLVADNSPDSPFYGRLYLVWGQFRIEKGAYDESPIMFSYSDDAGQSWSAPKEISGSNETYCTFQDDQNDVDAGEEGQFECDQDAFAYPAVGADGTLYVHFHNEQNEAAWEEDEAYESQIMVVKSTDGGATFSDPVHVVQMEDSYTGRDYPLNVDGRTTLTGHQFRVNSAGNIAVDTSGGPNDGRVYITFADNADGLHDVDEPVTNTNIFLAYSDDGGVTWTGGDAGETNDATRIRVNENPLEESDQWFPWAAVGQSDGSLSVLYMDGRADRNLYDITIASSGDGGATFAYQLASTAPSNPDQAIFFAAGVPGCEFCSTFIGDYNGLDIDTLGRVHGVWTDHRRPVVLDPFLTTQDAFYAQR